MQLLFPQDLHLADRAVAGVYLHATVAGHFPGARRPAVVPDMRLQGSQQGHRRRVRPNASGLVRGFTGRSAEPIGVDFVTFPSSLVGEYWPFVNP